MIRYIYAEHHFVILSSDSPVKWFDDLVGVAYRYYDLRMNVVPLFNDFKEAQIFWRETIKWWNDHSIKIRFVEAGSNYWFIMGAETTRKIMQKKRMMIVAFLRTVTAKNLKVFR